MTKRTSRRAFLRTAAGSATVMGAATGSAAAQEDGDGEQVRPDWGGWLEGVDGGYLDARGQDEVTVRVGASGNGGYFAFDPAGVWVDPGTTVLWEWTGEGGGHNVHAVEGGDFQSDTIADEGIHYERTFEEEGTIVNYQCDPHVDFGMKGAVAIGEGVPTVAVGGGGGTILPDAAKTLGVASIGSMVAVLGLAYVFLKYGGPRKVE